MHTFVWGKCWKIVPQNVLNTNGWNLQSMINVSKDLRYNQNFVPCGLSAPGLYTCIKSRKCHFLWNHLSDQFSPDFTRGLLSKGYWQFVQMVPHYWTRRPPCPYISYKNTKNFLLQNHDSLSWVFVYQICPNDNPKMTIDFLPQGQIYVSVYLKEENVEKYHFFKIYKD